MDQLLSQRTGTAEVTPQFIQTIILFQILKKIKLSYSSVDAGFPVTGTSLVFMPFGLLWLAH